MQPPFHATSYFIFHATSFMQPPISCNLLLILHMYNVLGSYREGCYDFDNHDCMYNNTIKNFIIPIIVTSQIYPLLMGMECRSGFFIPP